MAKMCCDGDEFMTKGSLDEQVSAFCKALSHPVRVKMLRILATKGACICGDLAGEFELAQSTVSEHLRILKEAELVTGTIDGPKRCYCVNPGAIKLLKSLIQKL